MPFYRLTIHGRMTDETGGFYTTRWCRAPDQASAAQRALQIVRDEWKGPSIHALEIEEGKRIKLWEIWRAPNRGSTIYID